MHYRIIDEQVLVGSNTMAEFTRVVRVVNQAAGLAAASQIELEFDPSYQALTLHMLDIVRAGQRVPKLDRKRVELLQREKQLEQRIYDGRVTVSIVLDDVRVGDEIELAYTVSGQNPVFGGKFVHNAWMTSHRGPVLLYQSRLLAPEARNIRYLKGPADATVESQVLAGQRETIFRRQDVPTLRSEPGAPYAALLSEQLQFSEFADWAEVAVWGEKLFREPAAGPRLAQKAEELRAALTPPADPVRETLRFVQQDVRYFGIEIGAGTHKPNPPDQVLDQRFGDCKDKVSLLAALLQRQGVVARPVLVSTRLRQHVDRMLPSPLAFDHVIARVDIGGKTLWLDPTRGQQTGSLAARQVVGMGRGLELAAGTMALSTLPTAFDSERMAVEDRIQVGNFTAAPTLESRITYRGDLAEGYREAINAQGLVAIADSLTAAYVKTYPKLRRLAPAAMETVADDDALTIVQRFALPEFWRFTEQRVLLADIVMWGPVEALLPPKLETRRQPLAFVLPGIYRHRVRVDFAEDVYGQTSTRRQDDGDAHFSLSVVIDGGRRHAEYSTEVRLGVAEVEPAQWPAFAAALNKALPKLGGVVGVSAVPMARTDALSAEIKVLEENLRSQRVKVVTQTQAQARFKLLLLTAQMDGGRLAPALKAQALVARGVAYDNVGRTDDARQDFEAALAIDGKLLEALHAAAVNAQSRGDAERAMALATQVLQQQPRDSQALQTRGLAHYMAGRVPEARADWEAALADRSVLRRGYPLIWLALATQRAGQDLAPLAEKYPASGWPTDWPRPVLDAVFGRTDSAAVLRAAKASKMALEAQTEALFYLGEKLAVEGDAAKARDQWRRVLDLGVVEYVEYSAARQRLAATR